MKYFVLVVIFIIVLAELSQEHQRRGKRRRQHRRSMYSYEAFQPWFPRPYTNRRQGRRGRQGRQGTTARVTSAPRSRTDLNQIFDRMLQITEIIDPVVPNHNESQMGIDCQFRWLTGLSSTKRSKDILFYDKFGENMKAIEFNVNAKNLRVYFTFQIGTFAALYTHHANGSCYIDEINIMSRFSYNVKTNDTIFDALKILNRSALRLELSTIGSDMISSMMENFFVEEVDNKIIPNIMRQVQYELVFANPKAVLERLAPGNN